MDITQETVTLINLEFQTRKQSGEKEQLTIGTLCLAKFLNGT